MSINNLIKYENWRAITEADYVTMFIKTWFTYISIVNIKALAIYIDVSLSDDDTDNRWENIVL